MKKILLTCCIIILSVTACGNKGQSIEEYCWENILEYQVNDKAEDGSVTVVISAPDYAQIIEQKLLETKQEKISKKFIIDALKAENGSMKTYTVIANSSEEKEIQDAFTDQIAKELLIAAFGRTDVHDEWEAGK